MSYVHNLRDVRASHSQRVGGKAASLGELCAAKLPVPNGFVVHTDAFYDSLSHIKNPTAEAIIATRLSGKLQKEIEAAYSALNSPFVAVRSSATTEDGAANAWAGQLESFVPTDAASLVSNIKRCWASLYSPRAIAYRKQAGQADIPVGVAVIVQSLIDSQFAGVGFSAHPVTGDNNYIVIEAVQGLGEAAVGGHVTPDTFIIDKSTGIVVESYPGAQDKQLTRGPAGIAEWQPAQPAALTDAHLTTLCTHIRQIESHFGRPMDIEWAFAHGTFYIVQSRPITTN